MLINKKMVLILTVLLSLFLNNNFALAFEYKPLTLDIPTSSYNEEGTVTYTIGQGDTLFNIGRRFGVDADLIAAINNIKNPNYIMPGQKIQIPKILEVTHQVAPNDTIWSIAQLYGILPQQILLANDIWYPKSLAAGTVLAIPGVKAQVTITSKANKISSRYTNNFLKVPTKGVLTSLFGMRGSEFHTGIDFANEPGTPIYAVQGGKVIFVGWKGNYGKTVIIDHLNGYRTLYGHNGKIFVKAGQQVSAADVIALMGNTGRSTGPHLHFEIYKNGQIVNPMGYLSRGRFR